MKKLLTLFFLLSIIVVGFDRAKAQDATENPGAYMSAIGNAETGMNKAYMAYISASAHSSRKKKIEKMRLQAVDAIVVCQSTINNLSPYKGDNSLKQGSINYVDLCYKVFNEDYGHIVNMEEITERSYDEMQAYLLLQQATDDTLHAAITRMDKVEKSFAARYNVNLVSEETELGNKMDESNRMSKYRNKVYLLFYKCNWEDNQLTEAVNQKNVTKIEQVRSALNKYAIEGLKVLDTLHDYDNDGSLVGSCKQALDFYKDEAETEMPKITDFFLKEENFTKLKSSMEAKAQSQRTQQDVDTYNTAVSDMNAGVDAYNQTNNSLNTGRNEVNKNWEDTEKAFIDAHTPYYK